MIARILTGVTGDQVFPACWLGKVRVAGTAALVGAVTISRGSTLLETLPAGTAVGVERDYSGGTPGTKFDANNGLLTINIANAGDSVLVLFN